MLVVLGNVEEGEMGVRRRWVFPIAAATATLVVAAQMAFAAPSKVPVGFAYTRSEAGVDVQGGLITLSSFAVQRGVYQVTASMYMQNLTSQATSYGCNLDGGVPAHGYATLPPGVSANMVLTHVLDVTASNGGIVIVQCSTIHGTADVTLTAITLAGYTVPPTAP